MFLTNSAPRQFDETKDHTMTRKRSTPKTMATIVAAALMCAPALPALAYTDSSLAPGDTPGTFSNEHLHPRPFTCTDIPEAGEPR